MSTKNSAGFLDLHIHGAFDVDVLTANAAEMDQLAAALEKRAVEAFLPTLVPAPLHVLTAAVARLSAWIRTRAPDDGRGAMPLGLHFEGPFVSAARCGALHRRHFLDGSDPKKVGAFLGALGNLPGRPMMTMAPEIPGGIELVRELVARGFLVSIGHTDADAATLDKALAAGARHMTHFGNAMRPFHHRDIGPVGWGLLNDAVTVDVIADLHHLSPEMLRLVFKAKGGSSVALVSDAIPAAGQADGAYSVWGETLMLEGGVVRNASGALAGSACLLDECVRRLESIGIPEEDARRSASDVPRRILGLS